MKPMIIAFSAILLFISCQNNASEKGVMLTQNEEADKNKNLADATFKNEGYSNNQNDTISGQNKSTQEPQKLPPKIDWDKKIIKNAVLNLEVNDFNTYNTSLRQKIKQFGGYVAQEQQDQSEYKIENTVTIKVPVDQFDDAVNTISANVKELKEKKISSQDVTTEVIDTRSRMETKKQVRLKYLDLLKQARNMEEILNVQSVVNGVQEEIESAAGRIEYLSHSSSFSTIQLTFFQVLNVAAKDIDKEPSFSTKVGAAFKNGWSWITELFVAIVSIWPLLLLVFAGIVIYRRTKPVRVKQV